MSSIITGMKVGTSDLNVIFDKYRSGTKATNTGFKMSDGTDISNLFQAYSTGTKVTTTGFKNSSGIDLTDIFQKYGTYVRTLKYMNYGLYARDIRTLVMHKSGKLIIGGGFTQAGTSTGLGTGQIGRIAKWDGTTFSQLGNASLSAPVGAVDIIDDDVYIGGNFTLLNGASAQRVIRYNMSTNVWSILSTTFNTYVNDLKIDKFSVPNKVYICGGNSVGRTYQYNTSTGIWTAIGSSLNGNPSSMSINQSNGDVWYGGGFNNAPYTNRIAKYDDISKTFSPLPNVSMTQTVVSCIRYYKNKLYIGGTITKADGVNCSNICYYDLSSNTYGTMGPGFNGNVISIVIDPVNDEIYAGGTFIASGTDATVKRIAKWMPSTNTWSGMDAGLNGAINLNGLVINGDTLYMAGTFSTFNSSTNPNVCGAICAYS
jgi:hypothetical protein